VVAVDPHGSLAIVADQAIVIGGIQQRINRALLVQPGPRNIVADRQRCVVHRDVAV
jgi:hypothetical protein